MQPKDILALAILFLLSFCFYTLPVRDNAFPFGEGDAAHKYGLADWMYDADKAPRDMPFFYAVWYDWQNPNDFYNPPNPAPYFIDIVATRIVGGGDRFTAPNLFIALTASGLASFSVYFLMRRLYTFWVAFLSGFLLLFPLQSVMSYLWGQRPHLIALAYIPLIVYCYYRYTESVLDGKERKLYIILAALLLAVGSVIYLQMIVLAGAFVVLYTLLLVVRKRKLPVRFKAILVSAILIGLVVGPFLPDILSQGHMGSEGVKIQNLSHLFRWFKPLPELPNQFLYQYNRVHGGWWTLPFLLIGLAVLLFRRKKEDLVILTWLLALYVVLHLYVANIVDQGRAARLIYGTSHVFYPIVVIGLFGLLSFTKLPKQQRNTAKYGLIIVFFTLAILFNGKVAYVALKDAYPPILRMTPYQYDVAQWLNQNIPENSLVYSTGQLTYAKMRWVHMFSQRASRGYGRAYELEQQDVSSFPVTNYFTHILIDYSDYTLIGNDQEIERLKAFEEERTGNATLLYDKNSIKVYQIAEPPAQAEQ